MQTRGSFLTVILMRKISLMIVMLCQLISQAERPRFGRLKPRQQKEIGRKEKKKRWYARFVESQGCPSTLGTSRKSAGFFERIPARDKNVRVLFSEKVINQIEMDVGYKIKMDDKFLFVSGKDRLILAINFSKRCRSCSYKDGRDRQKSPGRSNRNESRSPHGSPKSTHLRRTESQRSHSSPRSTSRFPSRSLNQERPAEEHVRQDPHKMSRSSPRGSILFEEIEKEFKEEVIELSRLQAQEEDEENYKHHECIRQLREDYMKKLAAMRA